MLVEVGHFALILAFLVALIQGVLPLIGAAQDRVALQALARPSAYLQWALIALAFVCLEWAFLHNDFSVAYVS